MNSTIDELLASYKPENLEDTKSALREIIQSIVLVGLSKSDFFSKASFYGGTSLRLFYGLNRFSEDLDFTLNQKDLSFTFDSYFPYVKEVASSYGIDLTIIKKEKDCLTPIESAFAKINTFQTFLSLKIDSTKTSLLHKDELMKVKFEVDKDPALGFNYESKWLTRPEFAPIRVLDLPSLFAGKIHAVLCRNYKNTVKGRDYYDFLFFISKGVSPNLVYLRNKLINTGKIKETDTFNLSILKQMLHQRFTTVNFEEASKDATRFLSKPENLSYYSREMFDSLVENLH
jgi:predicted nucleotidyltransferase component of viral defense system